MYLSFASRGSTTFCSQPQLFTFKSCPHTEHRPLHSSRQTTCMGKARSSCSRKIGSKSIGFPMNQYWSVSAGSFGLEDADQDWFNGKTIGFDPILREQLLLALPMHVVCREAGKGLW